MRSVAAISVDYDFAAGKAGISVRAAYHKLAMMFGYATNETPLYIPLTLALSHGLLMTLAEIRREGVDITGV